MCGIVGFLDFKNFTDKKLLDLMRDSMSYRGPDFAGSKCIQKDSYSVGLAHRRLSILDLSSLGNQPMTYKNLTIIHNGEVYNFEEIKKELISLGYDFSSNTDTEVILKAFYVWGVKCVERFRGMFAFSIYDSDKEKLYLFRDRAGVKPLYYYKTKELFLFGSELKTFYKHPKFEKKIDKDSLPYYFRFGYIPAPLSIFKNTHKLRAGYYLEVDCKKNSILEKSYWKIEDIYIEKKSTKSEKIVLKELEDILVEAFSLRMISDVPVGVFLSGGVDSTLVTALLQKNSHNSIKTFTIGFKEKEFNEASHAKEIANFLNTEHSEYYCSKDDLLDIVKNLPYIYDEPFGDSSAIPTHLVSKMAKDKVSVVLSGDGGDELFIGYSKYFAINKIYNLSKLKRKFLKILVNILNEDIVDVLNKLLPKSKRQKNIKDKFQKFKNVLLTENLSEMFLNASSYVDKKTLDKVLKNNSLVLEKSNFKIIDSLSDKSPFDFMSIIDYKTFMSDDILTKVDRASMSVSLEAREPLLDHKIVEYISKISDDIKYKNKTGKYLLKQILYKYIPKDLVDKPKTGFQIPLYQWLRNDLREELDFYLGKERLTKSNIYNVEEVLKIKSKLYSGKNINLSILWFILMFEMWKEKWDIK